MAYIRALIYDRAAANDVFQETCVVLWRKFAEFRAEGDFLRWALGIARNEVLRYRRSRERDRHVFGETLLATLAGDLGERSAEMEARHDALEQCLQRLSGRQHELVRMFYGQARSAGAVAREWNLSVHAVYKALKVLRRQLLECVERKLGQES